MRWWLTAKSANCKAAGDTDLAKDVSEVMFDSTLADLELFTDLLV